MKGSGGEQKWMDEMREVVRHWGLVLVVKTESNGSCATDQYVPINPCGLGVGGSIINK